MTGLIDNCDHITTATESGKGRPAPYMIFDFMKATQLMDLKTIVKVGDTPRDMEVR